MDGWPGNDPPGIFTLETVAAISRVPTVYASSLLPLAQGAMLLMLNGGHGSKRTYLYDPQKDRLVNRTLPLRKVTHMVSASSGRVLLVQQAPGTASAQFALWDPLTRAMDAFEGLMPPGSILCADVYGDEMVLLANRNTGGSACGFEWSDDDTFAAIVDLRRGCFTVPFHPIESLGAAAVAMLDPTVCFILGGGRTSESCYLRRADILAPQGRGTAPIRGIDVSLGSPPGVMKVEYAGRDSAGGVLLCGTRYSGTGSRLSRWTLDRPEFETVGRWDGPDGWFECAVTLRDGSTLVFWRVKGESQTVVRRYVPGSEAVTMGRLAGPDIVVCVGQASDGRVYVFGIEESIDADGRVNKKPVNRLSILTLPEPPFG